MSKKRTVCMIAAAVVSACMLAGIMLNYIVVDFSKIADKIGLPDLSFAGSVIGFFSGRDNSITARAASFRRAWTACSGSA